MVYASPGVDLSGALAYAGHSIRLAEARRWKGGVVGIGGKAAVTFRADHGVDDWLTSIWPEFRSRGVPATLGVVTDAIGNPSDPYEPTTTTWAGLLAEVKKGFEVWSHTATHRDPNLAGTTLQYELVGCKEVIEANDIRCVGFQQAGISPMPDLYSHVEDPAPEWVLSEWGRLLLANYGLIESGVTNGGATRGLPTFGGLGFGHVTLDPLTLAQAKVYVDDAISRTQAVQFLIHPKFIVAESVAWTLTDMADLLDYVVEKRDAGELEILTSSGMAFADPSSSYRLNLLADSSFENMPEGAVAATAPSGAATWVRGTTAGAEVLSTGGFTGDKFVRLPTMAGFPAVRQGISNLVHLGIKGQTMELSCMARAHTSDGAAFITIRDAGSTAILNTQRIVALAFADGWTNIRVPFTIPLQANHTVLSVELSKSGNPGIDYDDVFIHPV